MNSLPEGDTDSFLTLMEKSIDSITDVNGDDLRRLKQIISHMEEIRDNSIYNRFLNGARVTDIAKEYNYSAPRISQKIRAVREEAAAKRFRMQIK